MSLLSIIQNAYYRLGIGDTVPTTVIGNSDTTAATLLAFAQQEGKELARRAAWQRITKEQTFTSIASETQTGIIPSDLDYIIPETFYNRTKKRQVLGPLSNQEWQAQKSIIATVLYDSFRMRGNDIQMLPTPTAGMTYAFEYVSKNWCASSSGDEQSSWAADTDVCLLDEEIVTVGVVWRFQRAKGLDYAESFRTYETQCEQALSRDGSKRVINFANRILYDRPRYPGVTEGSWSL